MDLKTQPGIVGQLQSLKGRLVQTIDALREFEATFHLLSWPEILSQFQVITAKFASIQHDLPKEILSNVIVHPKRDPQPIDTSGQPQQNTLQDFPEFLPRVLLRTKLIPEIENVIAETSDPQSNEYLQGILERQPVITAPVSKRRIPGRPKSAETKDMTQDEERVDRAIREFDKNLTMDLELYLRLLTEMDMGLGEGTTADSALMELDLDENKNKVATRRGMRRREIDREPETQKEAENVKMKADMRKVLMTTSRGFTA